MSEEVLLKELRAARRAIQKMKAECNEFDEGFAIGKAALKRINSTLNDFRRPVAEQLFMVFPTVQKEMVSLDTKAVYEFGQGFPEELK